MSQEIMSQEVRRSQRVIHKPPPHYGDPKYEVFCGLNGKPINILDFQNGRRRKRDYSYQPPRLSVGERGNPRRRTAPQAGDLIEASPHSFSAEWPSRGMGDLLQAAEHFFGREGPAFGPGEYPGLYDVQAGDTEVCIPSEARTVPRRAPLSAAHLANPDRNRGSNLRLLLSPGMSISRQWASMPYQRPASLPIHQPLGSHSFHQAASPGSDSSELFINDSGSDGDTPLSKR
jgi:hypothetical protein